MEVISQRNQTRPYPKYLYHPDFNDPKIVNSQVEEAELGTKGWISTYLHKAYPKWVNGKIVKSKEEEERLLASQTDSVNISAETIDVSTEIAPPVSMFTESEDSAIISGGNGTEGPTVTKETQVDGQDTAMVEKPKKGSGKPKKT